MPIRFLSLIKTSLRARTRRATIRCLLPAVLAALPSHATLAASFDCQQATQPDERAICASRQLSKMDVEMAVRYETLTGLVAMGTRGNIQDEQRAWLGERARCRGNQACLRESYRKRIEKLRQEYAQLKSRGPF